MVDACLTAVRNITQFKTTDRCPLKHTRVLFYWVKGKVRRSMSMQGLVKIPEQYYLSSSADYAGRKGPVEISMINLYNLFYI